MSRPSRWWSSTAARGKLAEDRFCPSIEETTAEVMKALEA